MRLYNPAPGRKVTSDYGPRRHPISGKIGKMHRGIDYGGTFDVLSAADGVVTKVSYNGNKRTGGGHVVIIKHATKLFTVYYHGRERTHLKVGDRVRAGQKIYVSGSTGASTGPHLHFEVRTGSTGQWGTNVDPNTYLTNAKVPAGNKAKPYEPEKASLRVSGALNRSTWKAWQRALKANPAWGYSGIIDGIPGRLTWRAVQKSAGSKADGIPGPNTRKAVQKKLQQLNEYTGAIDGIWGRGTISALQRALNKGAYK